MAPPTPLLLDPYWKEWAARRGQPVLTLQETDDTNSATVQITLQPRP